MGDDASLMGARDGAILCAAGFGYAGEALWAAGTATIALGLSLVLARGRFA